MLVMESFDDYQAWTRKTAVYPRETEKEMYAYLALALAGESGEVAEKIKKFLRGDDGMTLTDERKENIKKELGDVLWYLARLSDELGTSFSEIAQLNHSKITSRQERGAMQGDGDSR